MRLVEVSIAPDKTVTGILTLATQVTRAPLNSRPSSFSTAVRRSAADSNSTKLRHMISCSTSNTVVAEDVPFSAGMPACLGVNDVKSGLAGKVLQVLEPESV